jgi:putative membrane-bound dehydrogenase-like protein
MGLRLLLVFLASLPPMTARSQTVAVGVAKVDITPEGPIRLHGYAARATESKGVQQRIHAKALAIGTDEQGPSLLVSVDSLGIPAEMTEELARRLKEKAGIARERLVVAASHTHSAPMLTGLAPNIFGKPLPQDEQARVDRYTRELLDRLEAVSLAALKDRRPALLHWGQGEVDFARNRRTPGGPVDRALPVLFVSDPDGPLRAVVTNYACHCTTLDPADNLISGDWAGYAQEAIEADHSGAIALTLIGCGGDANPADRTSLDAAKRHGRAIGDEIQRLRRGELKPLTSLPKAQFRRVIVPFDTLPTREQLEELVQKGGYPGYNAQTQLDRLNRGEPLQAALDYPVQTWTFGDDLELVFLAGEVVVDYALRLKRELDPSRVWITAYANDVPCYIPSERILKEGGYEGGGAMVYYGRPTRLRPGVEAIIDQAVLDLSPGAFRAGQEDRPPPDENGPTAALSPAEALRTFRLKPGLTIELVAAEPLVIDPVAIDFGADGRLWVCEMHDYPAGIDGNYKPGGRIKVLEDTDGDGNYDRATTFLDGLPFPTGVMAWRNGALICAAPQILYAEDTNGDGAADRKRVLYDGFPTGNYQARVNGLSYGLDHWVYGANGLIGGEIRGVATGKVIDIGGRDFRINPDTGAMEPASGLTQQGRVRNDWGDWFGNNNSAWLYHFPLPDHDAGRNPSVAVPDSAVYVPKDEDSARLYPASRTLARFNHPESANRVTSACGPAIYRDHFLGDEFSGNAFICEPVHNLVHREVLTRTGVTFAGHRAEDERSSEFLASTDHAFRPVQVRTGPDGGLWVVDMYRAVIEHPRWISPERLKSLDVRAGDDKGRIYRVRPARTPPRRVPRLDQLDAPSLAEVLDTPNGALRDTVQRVLEHRRDRSAAPVLGRIAREGTNPEARAQALCTLDGLGVLDLSLVLRASADEHPGVRRQAARLCERFLTASRAAGEILSKLSADPDATVRFQAALSLGAWDHPEAGRALGRLAMADAADPWIRAAVLSSAPKRAGEILASVLEASKDRPSPPADLVGPLIATAASGGRPEAVEAALHAVATPDADGGFAPWKLDALADLLDAIDRPEAKARVDAGRLGAAMAAARMVAQDEAAGAEARATAVRLLGREPDRLTVDLEALSALLPPTAPGPVRSAALRALARLKDDRAAAALIGSWAEAGPSQRAEILDALLARPSWAGLLLSAVEMGQIPGAEIDAAHRQPLLKHENAALRNRAAAVLAADAAANRQAVLDAFAEARTLPGDISRGAAVFEKLCAGCHRLNEKGHEVGPDLAALTDTTADALLTAILDPNREVDARYVAYNAALVDGRVLNGLIAAETGNAITLKRQDGQQDIILRGDLEALRGTGLSLMPEGLERDLTTQSLADLIAFVASGGAAPKALAGNRPELVRQAADGTIRLEAATAAIYGDTLVYEPPTRNLGYWQSPNDRAVWTFEVERPGTFTLSMEWACADDSAGQSLRLRFDGGGGIPTVIGGTGTWADYRSIFVEEVTLTAGKHKLEVRPDAPPRSALLDLRALVFTPR